jgi:predicted transcriptional regulator
VTLPPQQARILKAIRRLSTPATGKGPTLDELARALDRSVSTVRLQLLAMRAKGVVTWEAGVARSLRLRTTERRAS